MLITPAIVPKGKFRAVKHERKMARRLAQFLRLITKIAASKLSKDTTKNIPNKVGISVNGRIETRSLKGNVESIKGSTNETITEIKRTITTR